MTGVAVLVLAFVAGVGWGWFHDRRSWQVIYFSTYANGYRHRAQPMNYRDARAYAAIFGGDVVYYERRPALAKV